MGKTYTATRNVNHNGTAYEEGDDIADLTDDQAEELLKTGAIEDPSGEPAKPASKKKRK